MGLRGGSWRRWVWRHIIILFACFVVSVRAAAYIDQFIASPRWQAPMFGCPLVIASHHLNTQLLSHSPHLDKTRRSSWPKIALFHLVFIGGIVDGAASSRPVKRETFKRDNKLFVEWLETLPPEVDPDCPDLSQSLLSPVTSRRPIAG